MVRNGQRRYLNATAEEGPTVDDKPLVNQEVGEVTSSAEVGTGLSMIPEDVAVSVPAGPVRDDVENQLGTHCP